MLATAHQGGLTERLRGRWIRTIAPSPAAGRRCLAFSRPEPGAGTAEELAGKREYLCPALIHRPNHSAVLGAALMPAIGEDVDAAGDLDKLRNPPNPRN